MRILIVHNRYQQRGGEDNVVETESELLRGHGHTVEILRAHNDDIQTAFSRIKTSVTSIYSLASKKLIHAELERVRPDVVHVHNFFPTLSPSIFYACAEARIPVVHTMHNYRILCAASTLYRDGRVCEECLEKRSFLPGIEHACYRSSRLASAASGVGMAINDMIGTWDSKVSAYIALTEFVADKVSTFRVPRERVHVKANSAADWGMGTGDGGYALFVGRLTPEKGISTLLDADASGSLCMDLVLLGEGPMRQQVEDVAARPGSRIRFLGQADRAATREYMHKARVLVFPSVWYECLPLVILEAFSMGLPVLAADLPNVASLISDGETGSLFPAGDSAALAQALTTYAPDKSLEAMRQAARAEYLRKYTAEANYEALLAIYQMVIRENQDRVGA